MATTKTYDFLNRLLQISSVPSASSVVSFDYAYNDANQRVRVNLADGSFWLYEYDSLGQVRSGKRYWSDWTPVAGQQFEYGFDDIGNRSSTKAGGNDVGQGLRPASYTANSLNQYTQRDVPGAADIMGIAHPNATVTVNGASAYRRGEYYWKEMAINNASASVWQSVTNKAVLTGTTNTITGNLFLPKTPELSSYDADGNLTNDGRWAYVWDGENRLLRMVAPSSIPTGARKTLVFTYDSQSRRISKVVSNWTGSAWTRVFDERFLYDGWNLAAELNATNNILVRSYLWGLDLSGSPQGAGGVGGLLAVTIHGLPSTTHFACYDGNGNVVALVDGRDGTASARYEYGPFAEPIRASGSMPSANPHRFSTKYQDDETELYYYGYRYMGNGRWINRDPVAESGGINLYTFCRNTPTSRLDADGLACCCCCVEDILIHGPTRLAVDQLPGLTTIGHTFAISGVFNHVSTGINTPGRNTRCRFLWWERTDGPIGGVNPNTWTEMLSWADQRNRRIQGFEDWYRYLATVDPKVCPQRFPFKFTDTPYVGILSGTPGSRYLDFDIFVSSSYGCKECTYRYFRIRGRQNLRWNNGSPEWPADGSEFLLTIEAVRN
jgi:RHS repeat-associated protein